MDADECQREGAAARYACFHVMIAARYMPTYYQRHVTKVRSLSYSWLILFRCHAAAAVAVFADFSATLIRCC